MKTTEAISTVTALPLSKAEREKYTEIFVDEFHSLNDYEQFKVAQQLKVAVEVFEAILNNYDVRSSLISRMENKMRENELGTLTLSERKTYNYENCKLHSDLKNKISKLETIMKTIDSPIADAETGEIIEPAHFKTTEVLTFKFKK